MLRCKAWNRMSSASVLPSALWRKEGRRWWRDDTADGRWCVRVLTRCLLGFGGWSNVIRQVEPQQNITKPGFWTNDSKHVLVFVSFDFTGEKFIDMKFLWIAMNCGHCHKNGFRISVKQDVQLTKGTLPQHTAAPGCGSPAYRCLLRCHNERLHQIPSPLQRPWPLQNGVRQSNYCRTRIMRVDVVGLDMFLFWCHVQNTACCHTFATLCYCGSLFLWPTP